MRTQYADIIHKEHVQWKVEEQNVLTTEMLRWDAFYLYWAEVINNL